jgi:hypothetical protein
MGSSRERLLRIVGRCESRSCSQERLEGGLVQLDPRFQEALGQVEEVPRALGMVPVHLGAAQLQDGLAPAR